MVHPTIVALTKDARKVIIKDYSLPIPVYKNSDSWVYFYNLYNDIYDIDGIIKTYYDMGNKLNFNDAAIAQERNSFYDNMLKQLETIPTEKSKDVVSYPKYIILDSIYNESYNGKFCIQVDIKSANFSIMSKYFSDNVRGTKTYSEFASLFTTFEYLKNSKHIREKIFGKVCGSKFTSYIKKEIVELITFLYEDVKSNFDIVYSSNDDFHLVFKPHVQLSASNALLSIIQEKISTWEKQNNIKYNVNFFLLSKIQDTQYYIKEKEKGKFEIKNTPIYYMAQVLKAYKKLPLEKHDMYYTFENREAMFLEPLFSHYMKNVNTINEQYKNVNKEFETPTPTKKETKQKEVKLVEPQKTREEVLDAAMRNAGLQPENFYNPAEEQEQPKEFYNPDKDTNNNGDIIITDLNDPPLNGDTKLNKDADPFKRRFEEACKREEYAPGDSLKILSAFDKWNNQ